MLVKFISSKSVESYRGLVEVEGIVYANDEEKAKSAGYKPLVIDKEPVPKEGFVASLYYENTADAVLGRWKESTAEEVI